MRHRSLIIPLITLALALSPASAAARDQVAAEALFRAGREAAAKGDHATACARFAESQRLDPAPGTLINLGDCKAQLGLFASAWQHYQEAADRLVGDARLATVRRKLDAVTPRVSRLSIEIGRGAPAGTTVTRDSVLLGAASLGVALPIDKGAHALVVKAPGHEPKAVEISLAEGESKTVTVEPGPALAAEPLGPPPPPRAPSQPESGMSGLRVAGFVVGSLGLASLGAGAATGILTIQRKSTVDAHCPNKACDAQGLDAASEGKALSAISTATFITGVAALGAGVTMIVLGGRSPSSTVVTPAVGPGSAGLVVQGSF
jgi:hypothetical protein